MVEWPRSWGHALREEQGRGRMAQVMEPRCQREPRPMGAEGFEATGRKIHAPPTASRLGLGEAEVPGVLVFG